MSDLSHIKGPASSQPPISGAQRKMLASLATAKGRRLEGLFMAQGTKCVTDTYGHFDTYAVLATSEWDTAHPGIATVIVKKADLERISSLSTAPDVIAVYRIPAYDIAGVDKQALYIALDCVQDPGNLGTIMRVADWMGVDTIFASPDTADVWNPKVVQATMGAIARVKVVYADLPALLSSLPDMPVYGTFLNGDDIYRTHLTPNGIIVMGNEGNGISSAVAACVNRRITIPSFPAGRPTSESLNVAIATAITLSEFRRNG